MRMPAVLSCPSSTNAWRGEETRAVGRGRGGAAARQWDRGEGSEGGAAAAVRQRASAAGCAGAPVRRGAVARWCGGGRACQRADEAEDERGGPGGEEGGYGAEEHQAYGRRAQPLQREQACMVGAGTLGRGL